MRSECWEKENTGRKQRVLLKLSALSRGSGAHSTCNVHLNHDEVGKASYSRISVGLANYWNYFWRVGDCENQGGSDDLVHDRRYDPTVRRWMRLPRANFFSRVDKCENHFLGID
jgi:hypothetical protein